jgi:cytoskeletal protein CcmA (bactofilin family)
VTIGKEGRFDGEADISQLLLSGELRGRVHCRHASILVGGLFRGELFCESLTVEEGGRFDGICTHQAYQPETGLASRSNKPIEQSSAQPEPAALETKELKTSS